MPYVWTLPVPRLLLALAFSLLPIWAAAQISAARVMTVVGNVTVVDAQGRERVMEKGAEIKSGDRIVTADGALAQIRLNDGGYMSIRPGTEMVIDRFHYDERKPAESNLLISLLRGGMRSISGLIGKSNPEGYQIKSNTATVGIRGTDHEPMVIPPNVPELARLGAPGLYDKVNEGETYIRNPGGVLTIKRGEVGFTPANLPTVVPQMLKVVPEFYRVELKVDGRDPKDAASIDAQGRRALAPAAGGGLLRPTTAARRQTLNQAGSLQPATIDSPVVDRTLSTTTVQPATTTRLLSPAITTNLSTTDLQPVTTVSPDVSSSLSSTTALQPLATNTTTLSPSTTLVAPISSTLTTISPTISSTLSTTTVLQPLTTTLSTSTILSPTTTLVAPTTTSTVTSPTLSTTTISPTLSTTTTIIKTLK